LPGGTAVRTDPMDLAQARRLLAGHLPADRDTAIYPIDD
jgi:hypothetical protein